MKGRLQELVERGDARELARRAMTLQVVALDLHRQLSSLDSLDELARVMGLTLTGCFGCERLVVLRGMRGRSAWELVSHVGDVPEAHREHLPHLGARLAPFLPHQPPFPALQPAFSPAIQDTVTTLTERGFERAAWLCVEGRVEWLVLVGPKLSGQPYDEFDASLLQATFDACTLACSRQLLFEDLQQRNAELETMNRRLVELDDLKSAILAGVSHELRTPLTRVLSYAEALVETECTPEEQQAFLRVILDNARLLTGKVGQALQFAELIGGRSQPRRAPVALADLVEEAIVQFRESAEERGVRLDCQCERLTVLADPEYVRMILRNLIDNALKFTPSEGNVLIEVQSVGSGAALRVRDSGPGIPEAARERIWRLFEHGDISLRRETEGLGLGLALSQRLAGDLGVRLELVESSPAGSVFELHFPDAAPDGGRSRVTQAATLPR